MHPTRAVLALAIAAGLGGCDSATAPDSFFPACRSPAPLEGTAPINIIGYLVIFAPGTAANTETARLAAKYNFIPERIFDSPGLGGFAVGPVSLRALQGIRCEESVDRVEFEQVGTIGVLRTPGA